MMTFRKPTIVHVGAASDDTLPSQAPGIAIGILSVLAILPFVRVR